ncbi:MAG: helix-turn-helix transcriptional regulator [Eubacteriales bacterium]|nr:helix-turn-helix transcriptional regulator [Eubacteriales bacterium]
MSIKNCNHPVDENIVRIINEKGLKRKKVAQKAGYSDQMLCDMLNGRKIIKISDVLILGKVLEVDPNSLFKQVRK